MIQFFEFTQNLIRSHEVAHLSYTRVYKPNYFDFLRPWKYANTR